MDAWDAACADSAAPTFLVPAGKAFLLSAVYLQGSLQLFYPRTGLCYFELHGRPADRLKFQEQSHDAYMHREHYWCTYLNISAPAGSPNTDGVHIEESQDVQITHSTIGTGDDCISIGDGTYNINISHINCGPSHGIRFVSACHNISHRRCHEEKTCEDHETTTHFVDQGNGKQNGRDLRWLSSRTNLLFMKTKSESDDQHNAVFEM